MKSEGERLNELIALAATTMPIELFNRKKEFDEIAKAPLWTDIYGVEHYEDDEDRTLYLNIKNFGAKGDGVTDDITAIQKAYKYAQDNGGVVMFPPGIYMGWQAGTLMLLVRSVDLRNYPKK